MGAVLQFALIALVIGGIALIRGRRSAAAQNTLTE
jgi:hypothetical protein